jgi:hypothetical protein
MKEKWRIREGLEIDEGTKWRKWLKTNGKDMDKKKDQTVDVKKGFGKIGSAKL